jgi:hypothetical protein
MRPSKVDIPLSHRGRSASDFRVVQLAQNDVDARRDVHDFTPLPLRMGLSDAGHADALS